MDLRLSVYSNHKIKRTVNPHNPCVDLRSLILLLLNFTYNTQNDLSFASASSLFFIPGPSLLLCVSLLSLLRVDFYYLFSFSYTHTHTHPLAPHPTSLCFFFLSFFILFSFLFIYLNPTHFCVFYEKILEKGVCLCVKMFENPDFGVGL